mmetsp:Transcript_41115/g.102286  ORF Transcript_41115/g.102286 Transcript_41115/m.102286 type:complete len:219 (-) Transcript_41115:117-773(-)
MVGVEADRAEASAREHPPEEAAYPPRDKLVLREPVAVEQELAQVLEPLARERRVLRDDVVVPHHEEVAYVGHVELIDRRLDHRMRGGAVLQRDRGARHVVPRQVARVDHRPRRVPVPREVEQRLPQRRDHGVRRVGEGDAARATRPRTDVPPPRRLHLDVVAVERPARRGDGACRVAAQVLRRLAARVLKAQVARRGLVAAAEERDVVEGVGVDVGDV